MRPAVWAAGRSEPGDAGDHSDQAGTGCGSVIVGMRTGKQAARVDIGSDFEVHRAVVESVSVLFTLCGGDADSYRASGSPGAPLPNGWMVLRKVWNRAKDEVAPWWAANSKECYSAGLADWAAQATAATSTATRSPCSRIAHGSEMSAVPTGRILGLVTCSSRRNSRTSA